MSYALKNSHSQIHVILSNKYPSNSASISGKSYPALDSEYSQQVLILSILALNASPRGRLLQVTFLIFFYEYKIE